MYTLCLLMLLACGGADAPSPTTTDAEQPAKGARSDIDVAELKKRKEGEVLLLDVRTPAEFAAGHVPGAINVPISELKAQEYAGKGPVHTICAVGGRSSAAADTLAAAGVDAVNVDGGTNAWVAAGYPVDK